MYTVREAATWIRDGVTYYLKDSKARELIEKCFSPSNPPPYPVTSVNGQTGDVSISTGAGSIWYATCGTASAVGAKTATSATGDFSLTTGAMVRVLFGSSNTAANPTLSIDGSTAKSIRPVSGASGMDYMWKAGEVIDLVYDGSNFVMTKGGKADTSFYGVTKLSNSTSSTDTNMAATPKAVKDTMDVAAAAYSASNPPPYPVTSVNGETGAVNVSPFYAVCSTAAATVQKEITVPGITALTAGLVVIVKFDETNSADDPTLKVNDLAAAPLYLYGTTAFAKTAATTGWYAGAVVQLTYDGVGWVRDQAFNTNTTYTVPGFILASSASAAVKTASGAYYVARAGNILDVTIRYSNTKNTALMLDVNSTGAFPIYINGEPSSATNYTLPAGSYLAYFDGTNYYFNTDGTAPIPTSGGSVFYFTQQAVSSATNAEIFRITDPSITADSVCLSCVFADPSYIITDVSWTSYAGYISFTGTCTAATTADVVLVQKVN